MKRIAIVTTIDRRSAIARATLQMALALSELADVTIFAEPTSQPLACPLPLRTIHDHLIRDHDHVITVLGDSRFHVQTFWAARRLPSIVILHDVLLAHLVAASLSFDDLRDELVRFYGHDVAAIVMHGAATPRPFWDGPDSLDAPLFEPALESAMGVVVHSTFAGERVSSSIFAPVRVIPLAYESPWEAAPTWSGLRNESVLFTLGNANVNKCHELVIEALAELGDPTVRYVIAGSVTSQRSAHLTGLAAALGVGDQVDVLGTVSADTAAQTLDRATLCMNLRDPALEGGSASLVEQMAAGKCVMVFDHGCYSDAPDDAVVKISVQSTPQSLAQTIRELLADENRREGVGGRARHHASTNHTFEAYARNLLDFLTEVEATAPVNRVVRRVAATSRSWNMSPGSPLARRWARTIATLFDPPDVGIGGSSSTN
ncbi:MAG: glycosyltransferase [Ilumatobacteraceae bacterium]|nr:glycosyltransferase [Ilumatobacteraceae bacterium]